MPYKGKSPNNLDLGSMLAGTIGRKAQASGTFDKSMFERLAGRPGSIGAMAQSVLDQNPTAANQGAASAPQAPSVVQTAGATNMGQRINTIESRLQALEGSGVSAGAAQPAAMAASQETQADVNISNQPQAVMNSVIPTAQPQAAAASEQLGNLMASPFMVRQRKNMGPLMFKDQTGDGKITRADVIKARVEGYKK